MILLRKADENDISVIIDLAEKIWPETYLGYLSETQLRYMLDKMYNRAELLNQMQNGHTFLIASEEGKDLGFAGFSLTDPAKETYKLHKLYVLPETQGKGIGKLLINQVISLIDGSKALQLNVNRNNNAKDFYERMGFKIKETVDLDIGNGFFMNDYVMERSLS
ncbi:MAG: N-acetyltransferase [Pedobacter sp.]|nr:MAG: N-acetyltransferase [Pedobacter sp.]